MHFKKYQGGSCPLSPQFMPMPGAYLTVPCSLSS